MFLGTRISKFRPTSTVGVYSPLPTRHRSNSLLQRISVPNSTLHGWPLGNAVDPLEDVGERFHVALLEVAIIALDPWPSFDVGDTWRKGCLFSIMILQYSYGDRDLRVSLLYFEFPTVKWCSSGRQRALVASESSTASLYNLGFDGLCQIRRTVWRCSERCE